VSPTQQWQRKECKGGRSLRFFVLNPKRPLAVHAGAPLRPAIQVAINAFVPMI
jgi:hypothetical protein